MDYWHKAWTYPFFKWDDQKSVGCEGSKEEFAALPAILQKVVGSPNQLRDWAMINAEELNTVVASNVQRAYRTISQREQEMEKLPRDILQLVAGLAEQKRLSAGSGNA